MNTAMWLKALRIIPHVSGEEWKKLDVVSRWLIASRAAVLIMTFLSGIFAGLFAIRAGQFDFVKWLLVTLGIIFAHATNNLLNDYTDFKRGVDQDNYYRAQYGPQPLVHGLLTTRGLLTYAAFSGLIALACGAVLVWMRGGTTLLFLLLGAFFVLFYTWPLKYIALGELAVLIVWGPLMIGGGFYVITGAWDWNVVIGSLPYALGVTGVIFGKHIDKHDMDKEKHIHTLPVVLGEKISRFILLGLMVAQYLIVVYLVVIHFFSAVLLVVFFALRTLRRIAPMFMAPKPAEKPAGYPDVWPNYFVAAAFLHNREFGVLFVLGFILQLVLQVFIR